MTYEIMITTDIIIIDEYEYNKHKLTHMFLNSDEIMIRVNKYAF